MSLAASPAPPDALERALTDESRRGALFAIAARGLFFALLIGNQVLAMTARVQLPSYARYPLAVIIVGLLPDMLAVAAYFLAARSRRPLLWCFVTMAADMLLLSEFKFGWLWRPPGFGHLPLYIEVRYLDLVSFVVVAAFYLLPMSRRLLLWTGGLAAATWTLGIAYSFIEYGAGTLYAGPLDRAHWAAIMDPQALVLDYFIAQVLLFGAFVAFLVLAVEAARRRVAARVAADADLAFLARLLPPAVAERVARDGGGRIAPARRHVAVLFADTGARDIAQLQQRFSRIEAAAFAQGGIVDRFNGGPVMAVFGALDPDPHAARRALACARALARDEGVAVSLAAGEAICGEIGDTRSRGFSVVGDVVNIARRVLDEAAARGAGLVATGEALGDVPGGFVDLGAVRLRGREQPVHLWADAP